MPDPIERIHAEEAELRERLLSLLDEARRDLLRRAQGMDEDADAAVVITQMLRAVEQAAGRLRGGMVATMAGSRARALSLGVEEALETLPASEQLITFSLNPHLVEQIGRYQANLVSGLTEELRANVSRAVQVGMLSGKSVREMAREIGLSVKEPAGPFRTAAARCEAIAVTETHKVANTACYARGEDAETRIPGLEKQWHTAGDGRVRPSHYVLNGVTVGMRETFNVGGHAAQHPHDENLPAGEVVRCRCRITFVVPEEEDAGPAGGGGGGSEPPKGERPGGDGEDDKASQHPDDVLIRDLVKTGREATPEEVERIVQRVATAEFNQGSVTVPKDVRGLSYQGIVLGKKAPSLDYHLVKRVVFEEQWVDGTTAEQYVDDLRRAAASQQARLVVYKDRGRYIVTVVAPTSDAVATARLGEAPQPNCVVVYSANRGIIVSGYQASGLETVNIPEGARWLR